MAFVVVHPGHTEPQVIQRGIFDRRRRDPAHGDGAGPPHLVNPGIGFIDSRRFPEHLIALGRDRLRKAVDLDLDPLRTGGRYLRRRNQRRSPSSGLSRPDSSRRAQETEPAGRADRAR